MADIIKLDLTQVNQYTAGAIQQPFELTDYDDSATIELASGRTEEVGGALYRVESGDLTITDGGVANGDVYVLILDDGDDTASAYLSTKSGTFDPNKGGYYINDASGDNGAKVVFKMTKFTGPIYRNKVRTEIPKHSSIIAGYNLIMGSNNNRYIDMQQDNSSTTIPVAEIDNYLTLLFEYESSTNQADSSTPLKVLDITYDYVGEIYIKATANASPDAFGQGVSNLELYINGVATGIKDQITITVPGSIFFDLRTDYTIAAGDNIQLYAYQNAGWTPSMRIQDAKISLYHKNIFGTYEKGTIVL
jgi:hypothetical protein